MRLITRKNMMNLNTVPTCFHFVFDMAKIIRLHTSMTKSTRVS